MSLIIPELGLYPLPRDNQKKKKNLPAYSYKEIQAKTETYRRSDFDLTQCCTPPLDNQENLPFYKEIRAKTRRHRRYDLDLTQCCTTPPQETQRKLPVYREILVRTRTCGRYDLDLTL